MPGTKPTPDEIQERLRRARAAAETARRNVLQEIANREKREGAAFRRARQKLLETLAPDDPRVRALDRRSLGGDRMADFIETSLTDTGEKGDWVVSGRVFDAKGNPVAGAKVTLSSADQDLVKRFGEATTNAEGRFEVRHSAKDFEDIFQRGPKARVVVTSRDGKLSQTTREIRPAPDTIHNFEIRFQPEPGQITIRVRRVETPSGGGRQVVVVARRADGRPHDGLEMELIDQDGRQVLRAQRINPGEYACFNIPARPLRLRIQDERGVLLEKDLGNGDWSWTGPSISPTEQAEPTASSSLKDVAGFGTVLSSRLEKAGINQPAEVAGMEQDRLAELLHVSKARAKKLIDSARRTADQGDKRRE